MNTFLENLKNQHENNPSDLKLEINYLREYYTNDNYVNEERNIFDIEHVNYCEIDRAENGIYTLTINFDFGTIERRSPDCNIHAIFKVLGNEHLGFSLEIKKQDGSKSVIVVQKYGHLDSDLMFLQTMQSIPKECCELVNYVSVDVFDILVGRLNHLSRYYDSSSPPDA